MKIAFCLRAIKTLGDSDLASLTDKIEAYTQAGMDTKAAEMAAVDDMLAEVRQERAELQDAVRTQHPGLFVGPSDVKAGAITPDDAPADAPAAQEAAPADRRQKAAQMVRESVVKKTNANSAMVWQIIHEPTGEPVSGPPGVYPGRELLGSSRTMGNLGWGTKRDAEAALAELNRKADGVLGEDTAAQEAAPVAAESTPGTPLEADRALWKRIAAGQASVEDFKAGFESWTANKAVITDDFTAKKKDDLLQMGGGAFTYRYKSETKPQIVDALWRDGLSGYTLGRGYSYGMSTGSQEQAVRLVVESTDADQLAQYAADLKTEQEEVLARVSKMAEAIKDPKTLSDYQTWMRATMVDGMAFKDARLMLTPEQRAAYDDLAAEASRGSRKASTDADSSRVSTAGQSTSGEIIATKHTKLGHDLWVVKLADRVSKDDYGTLLAGAKRLGGNYSSYRGGGAIPGFQFRAPDAAQAFLKLAGGDKTEAQAAAAERRDAFADDRSQSATERLTEMADRLDERADESLGRDRKTNTSRRAGQAASAEAAASDGKAMAKTMRNLATAIGNGAAKFLDRVRQKVQVEMLQNILRTAHGAELRAKFPAYIDQELNNGAAPTLETADFAEFPTFTAYRSDLASLARQLLEVDGTKLIGQRLMKVADDVSGAYLEFAKANFHQVATFSSKSGGVASFGTSAAAEQALARSGYKGKAIAYQVKRGEHTVIMSPSEAMARGVWKGDGDKRITLAPDLGAEMVEKIGRAARRGAKVSVPWQLESAYDRRKALARMGIETPAEMRAALREFISLREQAAAPDKVKQLERAMIGRRNDGMDFFPTPEATADEMVAAADIQPGMRVLEPSAGWGHIAERIKAAGTTPEVGELSDARRELLEAKGFNVVSRDFLEFTDADHDGRSFTYGDVFRAQDGTLGVMRGSNGLGGGRVGLDPLGADGAPDQRRSRWESFDDLEPVEKRGVGSGYDRILMNPPFSDGRDIQHVRHAFDLLKPGGRVVAIMGEAAFTNQNKRAGEFRDWLESVGGTEEKLPTGTFLDSDLPVNTGANARMVVIDKTGAEPDTQFSRAESQQQDQPASSARRQAVEALVQQIAARWANAPEVVVVNSLDDPRVPESVRRDETTQQSKAGAGAPEGFFHDGKVYLIAEQLPGDADVVRVLLHEALGHFGLRGTFGADLGGILDRVAVLNAAKVRAKAKQYGLDYDKASDRRAAAEEVLAEMAQSTPTLGWGKKAIAAVRTWLRSHVPGFRQMALSDDEVVRSFILPARAFVQRGGPAAGNGGSASFSRGATDAEFKAAELAAGGLNAYASAHANGSTVLSYRQWVQVRTPSFKEWWGNDWQTDMRGTEGGVRQPANSGRAPGVDGDAAGRFIFLHQGTQEPRVFFHGTRDDFSTFDPAHPNKKDHGWLGVGHYVTSDHWLAESYSRMKRGAAESRVMELFVRPNNPKMLTVRQKLGLSRVAAADVATMTAEWVASGRRGAAVVYDDDTIEVATFDGSGLKSATGNSGAFDPSNADIRFSRASIADAVRDFSQAGARNAFLDAATSHGSTNLWHRTVGTQYHKAQANPTTFGRVFDGVQDYIKDTSVFANQAADNAPSLLPKLDSWRDLKKGGWRHHGAKPADTAKAGEAIFQGTLDKVLYDDATLASQFGLNALQIGLYREFRAATDESLTGMAKSEIVRLAGDEGRPVRSAVLAAGTAREAADIMGAHLADLAEQTGDDNLLTTAAEIGKKIDRIEQLQAEGYAPLMRFGKHTLHVTRPDGGTEFFGMYEKVREANKAARLLRSDPALAAMNFKQGVMSEQGHKLFGGLSLDSLELFASATGNENNPVYQEYLKLAMSNRSAMKRMIQRKAVKGYSEDVARVLASFVTSNARMASGNLHLTEAKKAAEAIPKEQGDLRDDAIELVDYVTNPAEEAAAVRGLLFTTFIGGSVASALVNLTQPITMTYPYLVQFGGGAKALKRMTAALAMVASGKGMSAGLAAAMARAEQDGIVSPQEIHHLQGAAMSSLGNNWPMLKKAAFVWGSMFSLAEQFNRRVSFVAAYQTAEQEGIADPSAFAEKAVIETQGLYNKGNKPKWARGAVGATVMTFKQFSIHYLEFLTRMWKSGPEGKKAVGVALALLLLTAGAGGLPFADDLDDLIDTLGQAMGHDTNSKRWKRQFIAQTLGLGDGVAEVATRGVTALPGMPIDLSLRMGMGNLLPATGLFLRSNTDTGRQLLEIAGAAGGLAANVMDGGKKILAGDPAGGVLMAAPMAAQNMAKAIQMWDTGEYRNKKGAKVMDVDAVDGAMKFIGFQPAAVALESNRVSETLRTVQLAKNVEGEIAGQWAQGMADGDAEKIQAAKDELADWNKANPLAPIKITMQQVRARMKALKSTRAERTMKQTPKELRGLVAEALN